MTVSIPANEKYPALVSEASVNWHGTVLVYPAIPTPQKRVWLHAESLLGMVTSLCWALTGDTQGTVLDTEQSQKTN